MSTAPRPRRRAAVPMWIHGGALIMGSREGLPAYQLERYLAAGLTVVSIDYRLAPETKMPAIIEDVRDAYAWILREGPALFGLDGDRVGGGRALGRRLPDADVGLRQHAAPQGAGFGLRLWRCHRRLVHAPVRVLQPAPADLDRRGADRYRHGAGDGTASRAASASSTICTRGRWAAGRSRSASTIRSASRPGSRPIARCAT